MIYDLIILGAGAAGLFLGANLKNKNALIIEKGAKVGRKILASGGGRCNITNANLSPDCYLGDEKFVAQILQNLRPNELLKWFAPLKFNLEKNAQYFCKSGARAVLEQILRKIRVPIRTNCEICEISKEGENFILFAKNGEKFITKKLVIATGGASFKALGGNDFALKIAQKFEIQSENFTPALVGFSVQKSEFWFKNLSGISLEARVCVGEREIVGDVLFAHRGISGPAILNASLFWKRGQISINFAPNFNMQSLEKSLGGGKKQLSSAPFLPRRFVLEFLRAHDLEDKIYSKYTAAEREMIAKIFDYKFAPAGNFGFEKAEVSAGGVSVSELDENCQSKAVCGLYFIAECLDVTGMLGGYNLHFAFASALCVAQDLNIKI